MARKKNGGKNMSFMRKDAAGQNESFRESQEWKVFTMLEADCERPPIPNKGVWAPYYEYWGNGDF